MQHNILLGSGYHAGNEWNREFGQIWLANTRKYVPDENVWVVSTLEPLGAKNEIVLEHNLGHIGTMMANNSVGISGWSASMALLAMLAYNKGADFVYKESDCLWVGDVLSTMYKDAEGKQMVFGDKMYSPPYMACAQSTFLVRHDFIPAFLSMFLSFGDETENLPENRFAVIRDLNPHLVGTLSFGVDRERPMPFKKECWYAQQITREEYQIMKENGIDV